MTKPRAEFGSYALSGTHLLLLLYVQEVTHFILVSYYIERVTTPWTYSITTPGPDGTDFRLLTKVSQMFSLRACKGAINLVLTAF